MVIISSHVTPPLRSLTARIVPPAVSRTQEILSRVCMCTNVRQKETGKVAAHGLAQGASAVRVWFVSGGFAPLERQKCC